MNYIMWVRFPLRAFVLYRTRADFMSVNKRSDTDKAMGCVNYDRCDLQDSCEFDGKSTWQMSYLNPRANRCRVWSDRNLEIGSIK